MPRPAGIGKHLPNTDDNKHNKGDNSIAGHASLEHVVQSQRDDGAAALAAESNDKLPVLHIVSHTHWDREWFLVCVSF